MPRPGARGVQHREAAKSRGLALRVVREAARAQEEGSAGLWEQKKGRPGGRFLAREAFPVAKTTNAAKACQVARVPRPRFVSPGSAWRRKPGPRGLAG